MSERPLKAVLIVEGGVVHGSIIPPGVSVETQDMDVEGVDSEDIEYDANHQPFYRSTYEGEGHLDVTLTVPVMPHSGDLRDENNEKLDLGTAEIRIQHDPCGVSLGLPVAGEQWDVVIEKRPDGWKLFVFDEASAGYVCLVLGAVGTHVLALDPEDHIVGRFEPV